MTKCMQYILDHGWTKGRASYRGRVCLTGCIMKCYPGNTREGIRKRAAAFRKVRNVVKQLFGTDVISTWNDDQTTRRPIMEVLRRAGVAIAFLMVAGVAHAQTTIPVNPTGAEWTVNVNDHADTDRYEMDVRPVGGSGVLTTYVFIAASYTPDPVTGRITSANWNPMPLPFGDYEAVIRACWDDATGAQQCSPNSASSNEFRRRPGAPGGLLVIP